ncbi:MAG: hypothetical protein KC492_38570 [Myxococcales bacterium]|nr:hypothetical protein [Myxococcales bacterium]
MILRPLEAGIHFPVHHYNTRPARPIAPAAAYVALMRQIEGTALPVAIVASAQPPPRRRLRIPPAPRFFTRAPLIVDSGGRLDPALFAPRVG